MDKDTGTAVLESPAELGFPPLLLTQASGRHLSLVSPDQVTEAKGHIHTVIRELKRLSHTLNAHCNDDDFDQPNAADLAIDELGLALAALGGGV